MKKTKQEFKQNMERMIVNLEQQVQSDILYDKMAKNYLEQFLGHDPKFDSFVADFLGLRRQTAELKASFASYLKRKFEEKK